LNGQQTKRKVEKDTIKTQNSSEVFINNSGVFKNSSDVLSLLRNDGQKPVFVAQNLLFES
jgi:hypothetical protein